MENSSLFCNSKINFSIDDLYNGLLISGDSGYGKDILRQKIQEHLIKNERGLTIINPSDNNIQNIIDKSQTNNIIHIQPTKSNIGFNILNPPVNKSHDKYDYFVNTMASSLTDKLVLELNTKENSNIIYSLIVTAIKSKEVNTIEDFISILKNKNKVSEFVQNNNLEKSFINHLENQDEESINILRQKIESWVENKYVKEFISETNSNYNIYDSIQNNKILLLDLSLLSPIYDIESRKQIIQFFLNRLWISIQSRVAINNGGHFLFINQYDNNYNIRNLISQARSYKLGLCVSVEHMNQLLKKNKYPLYNLNNKITFNMGSDYLNTKCISELFDANINTINELNRYEFMYRNNNKSENIFEYVPKE